GTHSETMHPLKKCILIAGLLLLGTGLLLLALVAGFNVFGRPAYRHYKETRAQKLAKDFFAQRDYRNAYLSARQTLQANPTNVEACRIMADLAEMSHSPLALDWRRRIVETAPTPDNKLRLAAAGLRFQNRPFPLAAQVLEEVEDSAKDSLAYQSLAGELALKLNHIGEAVAHFERACQLEPTNELHQLNLAALQLRSANQTVAAAAYASLERLRSSSNVGAVALRWLVAENLRRTNWALAQGFSSQLLADPHAGLDDRLQHLSLLQQAKDPGLDPFLRATRDLVATNAIGIYAVSTWMIRHGLVEEALGWLGSCPVSLQTNQPVPMAWVDALVTRKDWSGLEGYLAPARWGDSEYLRLAFLSRAAAEQQQVLAAETRWRTAMREAGDRLGALAALLGLADSWGQSKAKEELLWQITQRFPAERWAWLELDRFYSSTGNTRGLNKLYAFIANADAKNRLARNNLAATSFLLRIDLAKAHDLARELHAQYPADAVITSTYAFSLHLRGHTREGLSALEKLKPQALEAPAVALYYGLLLSANGETNKAPRYLELATSGSLLPEEKELLAQVRK
ncbi:MAG TPA: hypothetical protein VNZ22_17560, partial [Bacillota bacterium]|nr:hypothetical protein [Bacillota bacterium]